MSVFRVGDILKATATISELRKHYLYRVTATKEERFGGVSFTTYTLVEHHTTRHIAPPRTITAEGSGCLTLEKGAPREKHPCACRAAKTSPDCAYCGSEARCHIHRLRESWEPSSQATRSGPSTRSPTSTGE